MSLAFEVLHNGDGVSVTTTDEHDPEVYSLRLHVDATHPLHRLALDFWFAALGEQQYGASTREERRAREPDRPSNPFMR